MKPPGKKVGTLTVRLDRKRSRYQQATIDVELRLEVQDGTFHACYEGNWYHADTKAELSAQIKEAVDLTIDIEWRRYIVIDYEATAYDLADPATGRPKPHGRCNTLSIGSDRAELAGKRREVEPGDVFEGERSEWEDEPMVVTQLGLNWTILEISEPYPLPEDKGKRVRATRAVEIAEWGPSLDKEQLGDPEEQDDDSLPAGAVPWTAEREAFLREVLAKFGEIDAKLVELFRGEPAQLAAKLDERAFFGLLTAGGVK